IKGNASATQAAVISQLNPGIRGWAMYHRHAAAKATFSRIDDYIWRMLWRWALRRHPAKGARWVLRRYFRVRGSRSWAFATKGSADGTTVGLQLFRASTIAVTRHVKVPGAAH